MKISKTEILLIALLSAYILISMYGRANAVMSIFSVEDESYNDYTKLVILPFIGLSLMFLPRKYYVFSGSEYLFLGWLFVVSFSDFLFIPLDRFVSYSLQQTIWILSTYLFYNVGKKYVSPFVMTTFITFMCILMASCVFNELNTIRTQVAYASKAQVNEIYFLLCMIPWVMLIEGKYYKYVKALLLFLICGFTFYSMKRAAIVGLVGFLLLYLYGLMKQNKFSSRNFYLIIFLCIAGYYSYTYVDNMYGGHLTDRMESMASDEGSGRMGLYVMIMNSVYDFEIYNWLIGVGRGTIKEVAEGHSAHNEYLEVFYSWGIVGLCIYISILWGYFKKLKSYIQSKYFPICMGTIGMFVSMSMVTHFVINPYLMCIFTSFWGYAISKYNQAKLTKRI